MPKKPKKRADGRYQAKVKTGLYLADGSPDYKVVYGRSLAELEAAKEAAKKQAGLSDYREATVAEWLTAWLAIKKADGIAPRTYESYEEVVTLHLTPDLGRMPLAKIQPPHIRKMLAAKKEAGLSDRRVQYIYVILNSALKQAAIDRVITWNPCQAVKKPQITPRKYIVITQEQFNQLAEAGKKSRQRVLFLLAWDTGMRLGELLGLPWRCVDFKKHTVKVEQQVTYTKAMGVHITDRLKSKQAYRTIPVTAAVMAELVEHRRRQNEHRLAFGLGYQAQHDLVFPQEDGRPKDVRDVSQYFKSLVKALGLPPGLHFHDIRHTYASTLAELDVHPKKMQILLGHASSAFTMDVYSHKTDDMLKGIKEKLEKKRQGSQKVVKTRQTSE